MISRVAGIASLLLGLLSASFVWRAGDSPDSDMGAGLLVVAPLLALALLLGFVAYSARRP